MHPIWKANFRGVFNVFSRYAERYPGRSLAIVLFCLLSVLGMYALAIKGLGSLVTLGGMGALIIKKLFYILFFIVFSMVSISFAVLYYAFSFRNRETDFLLVQPVRPADISFFRFFEAAFFASWIPFLGLLMFVAAYFKINHLPFYFTFIALAYILPCLFLSCFFGYIVSVIVLRFLNLRKLIAAGFLIMVISMLWKVSTVRHYNPSIFYFLSDEVAFLKLAQAWFMPFSWPAWGLINLEDGNLLKAGVYLLNLFAFSLVCLNLMSVFGGSVFGELYFRYSIPKTKAQYSKGILDRLFSPKPFGYIKNFMLKDLKLFLREPILWLQFLVFFGLLFFYFSNLRKFSYQSLGEPWKSLIVFLNIFSVLCIVAAFAMRFVFPQWSMEGRSYWVLRLSPVSLRKVYLEKFILSFLMVGVAATCLAAISAGMLKVAPLMFYLSIFMVAIVTFCVVGISLGLGAVFADFKSDYYLKAVESIGGVIALLLNFAYVVGSVILFCWLSGKFAHSGFQHPKYFLSVMILAWVAVSLAIVWLATWLGLRALENKEY